MCVESRGQPQAPSTLFYETRSFSGTRGSFSRLGWLARGPGEPSPHAVITKAHCCGLLFTWELSAIQAPVLRKPALYRGTVFPAHTLLFEKSSCTYGTEQYGLCAIEWSSQPIGGGGKKPFHRVGEKISPNRELSHLCIGSFSHKWFLVPRHHAVPSLAPEQSEIPGGRGWGAAPCFLEMWSLVRFDRGSGCKWQGLVIACGTGANRPGRQMLRGVSTQQKPAWRRLGVAGRVGNKNRKRKYSMPV